MMSENFSREEQNLNKDSFLIEKAFNKRKFKKIRIKSVFFSFWPFPLVRGGTAYHHSPHLSVFNIRLLRTNFPISSFTTSKNLLFGLPLLLFPGNFISIIFLPTYSWSLFMTCPYHLSLPSLIFIPNRSTLTVLLMFSFLILSFLVTPTANLNIFISATSISSTCFFVTTTVSSPYTIAGLTIELYTFPFILAGNFLSQITPDTLLHPFHPACTLFFTSLSQPPLSYTVDPKYLNSFTLGTFVPSIFTLSSSFPPLCKDIRSLTYLLSSLFFPMHTSRILISAPLLPWSLHKSQYHQQTASSMVVLSLLHPLACPLSLQKEMDLTLIPGVVQP